MKKLLYIALAAVLIILIGANVNAQSQRLVLFEEFSNASCGPCAAINPALKTLLDANETKVVSVKYQTDWPGTDPMNAQNSSQVATRVSYYGVAGVGVPHGLEDGNVFNGHPGNYTQALINNEYAVSSPFTMNLSHTLSSDHDSIFITCTINCTQALTVTGPLKCHVAITENEIHFTFAPGSNGEKNFYDIMRKMLPSSQGTNLTTTWTLGQSQVINFAVPLPAYIYNNDQIAVVAWIQDNSDKNVKQAAFSAPLPDAGINNIDGIVDNINVYPNPFSNSTNVEFTLSQTEKVSANVYNLIGEKVWTVKESSFNAGTHQINVNGNNLTQGIYYLNINIGNSTFTKKLTVVK